jgi:hypothetical protein
LDVIGQHRLEAAGAAARLADAAPPALRVARLLSTLLVVLMTAAAAAGLGIDGLYRDPEPVVAMLRAYDLVSLVVAVPVLAACLAPARRDSPRAQLVWVGMLGYAGYTYAMYVFGTSFNDVFLLHVTLFSLAVFAFGLALGGLDVAAIAAGFGPRTPARTVGALLAFLGGGLGAMWVFYSLRFAVADTPPEESLLVLPDTYLHLAYVLDLALLVPTYLVAAVLLWRRQAWGYVLATGVAVFSLVYQVNYVVALLFQWRAGVPGSVAFDPQEPLVVAVSVLAAGALLRSVSAAGPCRP